MHETLSAQTIDKYKGESTARLKSAAITVFHAYIRKRDSKNGCISCGYPIVHHAGHFHPAGKHNNLRFHEDNIHGQCVTCNIYLDGNLINYRSRLLKKIGAERLSIIDMMALDKRPYKDDRLEFIAIIEKYK